MCLAYQQQMNRLNNEVENIYREAVTELFEWKLIKKKKVSDNEAVILLACSFRSYLYELLMFAQSEECPEIILIILLPRRMVIECNSWLQFVLLLTQFWKIWSVNQGPILKAVGGFTLSFALFLMQGKCYLCYHLAVFHFDSNAVWRLML